jgi:cytochrome c-type biogenesis protein CcmH/NrfF
MAEGTGEVGRVARACALALVLIAGAGLGLEAQSARQQANALAHVLMSPFCPGKLLADCTSPQAYELRDAIARRLDRGETPAAVQADLVREYGSQILGAPPARGVGLLAWWLPAMLATGTAVGLGVRVRAATRAGAASTGVEGGAAAPLDPAIVARLDDELAELD